MTTETDLDKINYAVPMFDTLRALWRKSQRIGDGNIPDLVMGPLVNGYMLAYHAAVTKEAAPANPKQRRTRRKKPDMVELANNA